MYQLRFRRTQPLQYTKLPKLGAAMTSPLPDINKQLDDLYTKHARWNYSTGKQGSGEELHFYLLQDVEKLRADTAQLLLEAYEKGLNDGHAAEYETQTRLTQGSGLAAPIPLASKDIANPPSQALKEDKYER